MSVTCSPLLAELIFDNAPIGGTIGVAYLGVAISAMAYGVTCCQTFYYFRSEKAKDDHRSLWFLVAFLWLITGLQEALIIHGIYWYLVTNFSDPCTLISHVIWSIPAEIFLNSPLEIGVEGFLLYRTWKLSRNVYVTSICGLAVLAASAFNVMYSTELLKIVTIQDAIVNLRWLGITSLGTSVFADALITVALVYCLYQSRTGFRRSDSLVTKLIVLTISTGALTTLITLAELMAYEFGSRGFYVVFFTFLVGKMYLNSMLTALNVRGAISGSVSENTTQCANSFQLSRLDAHGSMCHLPLRPPAAIHPDKFIDIRGSMDMRSFVSKPSAGGGTIGSSYLRQEV